MDDGSDPPAAIDTDARARLVRLASRSGPGAARNAGVAAARGKHVVFLDDDDVFTNDRLEIVISALGRAPVVVCGARFLGQPSRSNRRLVGDVSDTILDASTPHLGVTTIDRSCFIPFREDWLGVEDVDWWLRTAANTPVSTVSGVGYLVRHRARPEADRLPLRVRENYALLEEYPEYFRSHPRARAFRLKRIGLMSLAARDRAGAATRLCRVTRSPPRPPQRVASRPLVRSVELTMTERRRRQVVVLGFDAMSPVSCAP